jgi:hypothetical protein
VDANPDGHAVRGRVTAPRVLFLGGLGRSGTTVLERVLGEVPGACSVGELVHLWQRGVLDDDMCGCGTPFSRCEFWNAVGKGAFGGWNRELALRMIELRWRVDRTRHVARLIWPRLMGPRRPDLDEYVGNFLRLYRAIVEVAGADLVVDSSKHSSLAFCLRTADELDLRILHVVRDSRGVAHSWAKEVRRPESAMGDSMARFSPARTALLWVAHNLCLSLLRGLGATTRLQRYEDFTNRPRKVVGELVEFAGLTIGPTGLDFLTDSSVVLTPSHTVAGNPMRFHSGELTLRRDDAWRKQMPRGRRGLVSLLTLPLLARYGYLRRTAMTGAR